MTHDRRLDPELLKLQKKHVATLNAWHAVSPDPSRVNLDGLTADQLAAFEAAMAAEAAYDARKKELGLLP